MLLLTLLRTGYLTLGSSQKKADYDRKILDIEKKYFTASDYNKFKNDMINVKIKQKELVNKYDIFKFVNNSDLDNKVATLATKVELKA